MTLKLPVVVTFAPFSRKKLPETLVRPVSALLLPVAPASATRAFAPLSYSSPLIVVIWPLLNSKSASFSRKTVPVSTPFVPNPAAALATFKVAWTAALPVMLICAGVGEPARPFHRQSVGRRDAGVADVDAVAVGAVVGQLPADRQAGAAGAADVVPVEPQSCRCR